MQQVQTRIEHLVSQDLAAMVSDIEELLCQRLNYMSDWNCGSWVIM